ncbi:hypothetical protein Pelo_211 [Pelomyxa schiedti]|nr:hypothetical protein Pelo_211 [Pelomyxa schiedti]
MCCVCHAPAHVPVVHECCGSWLCSACSESVVTCPVCEERISDGKLKPVTAKRIMLKLAAIQVRCPTCNQGTERDSLDFHVSHCPSDCPKRCGTKSCTLNKKNMKEQSAWPCAKSLIAPQTARMGVIK